MAKNRKEYMKEYMQHYRRQKKTTKNPINKLKLEGRSFDGKKFAEEYESKLENSTQRSIYDCIFDVADMMENSKNEINKYGSFSAGATGGRKVNPALKEYRESTKLFCFLLEKLQESLNDDGIADPERWLEDE